MSGEHKNHGWKALELKIDGMHCANCEVLVERRFKKIAGVRKVKVSHVTGRAEVTGYGDLDLRLFQRAIEDDGYSVARLGTQSRKPSKPSRTLNSSRDYIEIGAVFLVLVWLYVILGQLDLLPQNFALPNDIGYDLAFLVGVVASMSTCIAVTGGLLVAVAAKYNEATTGLSAAQKFRPHIFFNVGRVTSYTLLGGRWSRRTPHARVRHWVGGNDPLIGQGIRDHWSGAMLAEQIVKRLDTECLQSRLIRASVGFL